MTDILKERSIVAFPDFVSNAGEILAVLVNKVAKNADEIFDFVKTKITEKTFEVIEEATQENLTPYDFAVNDAMKELIKKQNRRRNHLEKLNKKY